MSLSFGTFLGDLGGALQHGRHRGLVDLDLHVVSHLQKHGGLLHIADHPVNPRARDYLVTRLEGRDQLLLLLALLLLRANQQEIEDHADKNQRSKLCDGARRLSPRGGGIEKE